MSDLLALAALALIPIGYAAANLIDVYRQRARRQG